jgi:hypothetical protein
MPATQLVQDGQLAEGSYLPEDIVVKQIIGQALTGSDQVYLDSTVIQAAGTKNPITLATLTSAPTGNIETTISQVVIYNGSYIVPVLFYAFKMPTDMSWMAGIGAGVTAAKLWANVSDASADTELLLTIMTIQYYSRDFITGGSAVDPASITITTTGTGTTRTVTASADVFVAGDYNSDVSLTTYIETSNGRYPINGYTDAQHVTITVPSGYTNQSNNAFSTYRRLYSLLSGNITNTTTQAITCFSTIQSEFSPKNAWTWKNRLAVFVYAQTTNLTPTTITLTFNGNTRYSYVQFPKLLRVRSLRQTVKFTTGHAGINYQHLIATAGTQYFGFHIPIECKIFVDAYLLWFLEVQPRYGVDVDFTTYYGTGIGTAIDQYSTSDTTATYTLPTTLTNFYMKFGYLLPNAVGNTDGAVAVTMNTALSEFAALQIIIFYIEY